MFPELESQSTAPHIDYRQCFERQQKRLAHLESLETKRRARKIRRTRRETLQKRIDQMSDKVTKTDEELAQQKAEVVRKTRVLKVDQELLVSLRKEIAEVVMEEAEDEEVFTDVEGDGA